MRGQTGEEIAAMNNTTMTMDKEKIAAFLKSLCSEFEVVVPTIENGNLQFGNLDSAKLETGFKGRPPVSPKEYLFPQKEEIFTFDATDKVKVDVKEHLNKTKRIVWGVRPCDLYGIKTLDTIFLGNYVDTYYKVRRGNTLFMGLNCNEPCDTCFCLSCKTGPFAKDAFDLLFTDLGDKYLVNIGSEAGKKIVDKAPKYFSASTAADLKKASDAEKKSQQGFKH
jgi:sulfhydrogenase subunit beta (sulfur reductase)